MDRSRVAHSGTGGEVTLAPEPLCRGPRGSRRLAALAVTVVLAAALSIGCTTLPNPFGGPATPEAPASGSPSQPAQADTILAQAINDLKNANSFRFQASAVHRWEYNGRQQEWVFVGEGAYEAPDKFYSRMEGPADADLRMTVRGSQILAADSRGEVANPTLAYGGPGNGASPLTVISYLRNYQQAAGATISTLNNQDVYRINFVPNLSQVAALDVGQSRSMARIQSVEGQVWVDRDERRVRQQQVTVRSADPGGGTSSVQITMRFSDFNRPVEIRNP
jgi:hypothetical protein